ncbi:Gp49 family protein [Priestia megaterium]|uniref:Gp49 family protein n=1 Tax=Priestia megaterium TaxID=1404 RepID=UPI00114DBE2F
MKNTVTTEEVQGILSGSSIDIKTIFNKCTVVTAKLPNGFIIVESSACVDPANYDEKLGVKICMERIENKVWELEGYKLQSALAANTK